MTAPRSWKKRSESVLFANPWWSYKRDEVELPSGQVGEYHYVDIPGSVMIIAVDDRERILLTEQYRYLNERTSIEFPGGGVRAGIPVGRAAADELAEEAGVTASQWSPVGRFNPYNGVTNEWCTVFLARGLEPCNAQADATEEFMLHWMLPDEIQSQIGTGMIWDGMTLAAWLLYQARG